ncbi:MAG: PDZ domain-containing protein, partial [Pseudomonadales bacterium]
LKVMLGVGRVAFTQLAAQQTLPLASRPCLTLHLYEGSPAFSAGLQQGDIITKFNGQSADNARAALDYIANLRPGSKLSITYLRQDQEYTTEATIGIRPTAQ